MFRYLGNLDIANKHPHGNCKLQNPHVFQHTPAATIQKIDELVARMPGAAAYKTLVSSNGGIDAPRNSSQCHYRRKKYLSGSRISQDEISNVTFLSYELNRFFKMYLLQPQLLIVLMHEEAKQQFSNLLKVSKEEIPLYYDTTFSLGEIYVSVRTFIFLIQNKV